MRRSFRSRCQTHDVNKYSTADVVIFRARFRQAGAAIDPQSVTFEYFQNATDISPRLTYTYTGLEIPTTGAVARVAKGDYVAQVALTTLASGTPGGGVGKFFSIGAGQGGGTDPILVTQF